MVSFQELEEEVSAEDEVEDGSSDEEEDLGAVEEERSVILHLLSQLKLGMDLTRVGGVRRSVRSKKSAGVGADATPTPAVHLKCAKEPHDEMMSWS